MELKNKKILVTGADGFIGSHLTEKLLSMQNHVRALSYYNSFNSWGWLDTIDANKNLEVLNGDIRDPYFCKALTRDIDIVFHLAALIAIPYSYTAPNSYVDTNITGTLNICEAVKENKCKKLIHTSTSEVYGTAQYVPIDENHPLQPQSPYSATKIAADSIAKSYYYSFDLPVTIARPFNTYGPRQSARAVIPTIIIQLLAGKKEIELGKISPTRDFNFVKDTCSGLVAIAESDNTPGEVINIGTGKEISIENLFSLLTEMTGNKAEIATKEERLRPEKSEVERLLCDNSLIKTLTNFSPQYSLQAGLRETVEWFADEENLKQYKSGIYNV